MFAVGYLCGYNMGRVKHNSCVGGPEITDMSNKADKVLKWIKQNPYHTCQEIAKECKLTVPSTNGILIALMRRAEISRTQEYKYYI